MNSIEHFFASWDHQARTTIELLKKLPPDQYDFRPDPGGRSIGELAWHLAEMEAYVSLGVVAGAFPPPSKPENIQRPRSIEELAPGYQRVHREARERLGNLQPSDL